MTRRAALALFLSGPALLAAAGPACAASKEEIGRAVERVYARPEFQDRPPAADLAWLAEALARLFRWLGDLHQTSPALFWVLLVGCVVALVLLLAHIGWTVYRVFYVPRRAAGPSAVAEQRRLARRFRDEATNQASAGDYTAAVRLLFLALLYEFEERGSLLPRPALTNREYLATVADRPELHRGLAVFVDLLDENWYGERPTTSDQYDACADLSDSLRQRA